MINLTDLIGKPVINLYSGRFLGTVENAVFTAKADKLAFLSVFDENKEDKQYFPCRYILHAQNNAVMVKNCTLPQNKLITENCPLRSPLYNYDGTFIGIAQDIVLSDSFDFLYITDNNQNIINKKNIVSFSNHAIIVCFDEQILTSLKRVRPKKEKQAETEQTENEGYAENDNSIPHTVQPPPQSNPMPLVKNIVPPVNYLIGRKTTVPLYDSHKNILVDKNAVITGTIIDRCRKYNKLMTLAKNSKKDT